MGAESSYYLGLQNGYSPSNQKFYNIEELKQVRGFKGNNYKLIEPYITAQPNVETQVNVNTASGLLLASLSTQLDPVAIQGELDRRKQNLQYFGSVNELWSLDSMKSIDNESKIYLHHYLG